MPYLTDPEETLQAPGIIAARTSPGKILQEWQELFHALPTELHINIMANLHRDPVSQICFGLTSSYFYWQVFHEVHDEKVYESEEKRYPIKTHPFDLRFQVSICGQYSVFGWSEYGYLLMPWNRPCSDIAWEKRNLGQLLLGETGLWHDLRCCEACVKYKPDRAFETADSERKMMEYFEGRIDGFEDETRLYYQNACTRCRLKWILVILEEREEEREEFGNAWEERRSLGLKSDGVQIVRSTLLCLSGEDREKDGSWSRERYSEEIKAYHENYETWESIFERLGV